MAAALAALLAFAAVSGPLRAQSHADPATVVITAARAEQALPDALPSTRVIGRAEIDALQPADLPGLLRALTSIDVAQTGPLGSQASLFLRGADSRQTLVLVDGVPLVRADFGSASWQHLPIDQIERVEIVRGNMSSLYGAQAIGGVVQIVTRRVQAPQARMAVGSQGTLAAALSGGARFGSADAPTRLSAALSARRTDGYSARDAAVDPAANPDRDAARQRAGSLQLEQVWAAGHRTQLNLLASRTRSAYDGFTPALEDVLSTRTDAAGLHSRHAIDAALAVTAEFGQTREHLDDPTGLAPHGSSRVRLAGAQLAWQPSPAHEWQFGTEAKRERFSDSATPERTRATNSLRLGWRGRIDDAMQVQANLRSDRSSAYGRATTGLLAVAYMLRPGWKASAQVSSAFSAPSFLDELYANPATTLRAERSRQAELALQWSGADLLARAALFAQRQRERIAFDPVTFETVNIARARNEGLEVMAQAALGPGRLGAELTLQDPRDAHSGQALKRRARQSLALNYSATLSGWQATMAWRHTGKRLDTDPLTFGDALNPARTTLDLAVQRQLTPTWRVSAKVDNLADVRASEVLGYTAAPRSVLVTLQATR